MNGAQMNWGEKWPNPYIGPRPYTREEHDKMGGREKETGHLLNLLIADRIILLHAPSGAGKTSLVQAGLIPRLEDEEDFWVSPPMRVHRQPRSGDLAEESNRYLLSLLLSLEEAKPEAEQLSEAELAALDLQSYLEQHLPPAAAERDQVFIFDQFEEILTVDPFDEAGKFEFFNQVGQALRDRGRWALFIARDDYVARLEPYLLPIPSQLSNTFHLDLLRGPEALQAIRRPVTRARFQVDGGAEPIEVHFEQEAADTLVDRLRQDTPYVEPVILQVVCLRLWGDLARDGRLEDGLIDVEDLEELVDVSQALSAYYADSVARTATQTAANERQVRDWVEDKLINQQGIRTLVLLADEDQAIARELVNAHLVRVEERRGSAWAELAHDRLVDPVLQDNEAWRQEHLSTMQLQAELWADRQRPDELLFSGDALEEAEAWVEGHEGELTAVDEEFLDRSRAIQAKLDAERKRRRLFISAIGIFGIIAIILAFVALTQYSQSEFYFESLVFDAREASWNGDESLILTTSFDFDSGDGRARVWDAISGEEILALAHEGIINQASWNGDESLILTISYDINSGNSTVRVWDAVSGEEILTLAHESEVKEASWNGDESLILTAARYDGALVWDAVSGEEILALAHEDWDIRQASWNGDGSLILTVSEYGAVRVWDAVSGEEILTVTDEWN